MSKEYKEFKFVVEEEEEDEKHGEMVVDLMTPSSAVVSDDIFSDGQFPMTPSKERICKIVKYVFKGSDKKGQQKEYFFSIPNRYVPIKMLGEGAYGFVISAYDKRKKTRVAIKVMDIVLVAKNGQENLRSRDFLKRILREILLLKHFSKNENVIRLIDLCPSKNLQSFRQVIVVTDLMSTDLFRKIKEEEDGLEMEEIRKITYDILKGMRYVHTAGVLHRDIKPQNILIRKDCSKLCDFGLARGVDFDVKMSTSYVVTRWYRAPELLMMWDKSSSSIDCWSIGCVLGEMLSGISSVRRVLFKGQSWINQLERIVRFRGTPPEESMFGNASAIRFVKSLGKIEPSSLKDKYPKAPEEAIDLLDKLLTFDAQKRITCEQAIQHPWFKDLYEYDLEHKKEMIVDKCEPFEFRVPENITAEQLKEMLFHVVEEWNDQVNDVSEIQIMEKLVVLEEEKEK